VVCAQKYRLKIGKQAHIKWENQKVDRKGKRETFEKMEKGCKNENILPFSSFS
jgi:hypothetical protein